MHGAIATEMSRRSKVVDRRYQDQAGYVYTTAMRFDRRRGGRIVVGTTQIYLLG